MFRITGYRKMQIGLGVLLVVAVLLTLVAAAWPMMTAQAGHVQPDGCVTTYFKSVPQPCGTCGYREQKVIVYKVVEDPCSGWGPIYYYDHYYCVWC